MYFDNRRQAGELLATELYDKYRYEDCAIVALTPGGVLVGEPIAERLHSILTMIVTEDVELPGDTLVIGSVSQDGRFIYNNDLSYFEIQDYTGEFSGHINDQRRVAFQKINRLMGDGGAFNRSLLQNRNIILVADGLSNASIINIAMDYLKPVKMRKLIVAMPVATVQVVDFVHVRADEVHILDVKSNYLGVNHYYEDNNIPSEDELVSKLNNTILNWSQNDVET